MTELFQLTESFHWLEAITPLPYPNTIKIVALNVGTTGNQRNYLRDELIRAARTMNGKPIYFGSSHEEAKKVEVGIINWAEFESDRVEAVGTVSPEIYARIQNGEIPYVSIEANFIHPERIDGIAPKGLEFTGLLLLPKGIAPGDPNTSVMVMERIGEILHNISSKEGIEPHEAGKALNKEVQETAQGTSNSSQNNPSANLGDGLKEQGQADYPWDQCVSDMKAQGHDDDSAARICAAIKNRTVNQTLQLGLAKTEEEAIKVVAEKVKTDPLFGYLAGKVLEMQNGNGADKGASNPQGKDASETQARPKTQEAKEPKKVLEQLNPEEVYAIIEQWPTWQNLVQAVNQLQSRLQETKPRGKGIISSSTTKEIIPGLQVREINFGITQFSDLLRQTGSGGKEDQQKQELQKEVNQ